MWATPTTRPNGYKSWYSYYIANRASFKDNIPIVVQVSTESKSHLDEDMLFVTTKSYTPSQFKDEVINEMMGVVITEDEYQILMRALMASPYEGARELMRKYDKTIRLV